MKFTLLLIVVGLAFSYNPSAAVNYALAHCRNYNPAYNSYPGADCANFVSQCLKEGGFDFSGCSSIDEKGVIYRSIDLRNCLEKKGWKKDKGSIKNFKEGYPFFMYIGPSLHSMISTIVAGNKVIYNEHKAVGRCNLAIKGSLDKYEFYYPPK